MHGLVPPRAQLGTPRVPHLNAFTRWSEWNGPFRDAVRRFVRGDVGAAPEFATRFCGSQDMYQPSGRLPHYSVNFVTAHDGFTLADLVAYQDKHNAANGEGGVDGEAHNHSWNSGHEGRTDDPAVVGRRDTALRALVACLALAQVGGTAPYPLGATA